MDVSDYNKMDKELQGDWKKTVTQYNHLIQEKCFLSKNPDTNLPHNSPEKYVEEITNAVCTAMKIDNHEEISSTASKILKNAKVFGKNPKKLAAAAVYLSCRKHEYEIDIYKIVKIVEASSNTIKTIARELNDNLRLGISL
jgi:transcription initiation factor TFIIIB Brf1 subunit/transcription initiation factor TFIIB